VTIAKRVLLSSLLAAAVSCGIGALYALSILTAGEGGYGDLIWPVAGVALLSICAAGLAGIVWEWGRNTRAKLRMMLLCLAASGVAEVSLFYGVLANRHLFQTTTVIEEKQSPNGSFLAIHLVNGCKAIVGDCPPVSKVRLVQAGGDPTTGATLILDLSKEDGTLRLDWLSNGLLQISYSGSDRIVRRERRVGGVNIRFLPIGIE
jgi:hypothetical protein